MKVYPNVHITVVRRTLRITSSDAKGTFILSRAACSMVGELMHCLPDTATLQQFGETRSIELRSGSVWFNNTEATQQMPLSSTQVPPRGILLTLQTPRGTYLSLTGTVDEITK